MNVIQSVTNPRMARSAALFVIGAAVLGAGAANAWAADPQPTDDGKTLVVPAADASKGTVYYVVPGKPGAKSDQTRFTNTPPSDKAPKLAWFTGLSNGAIGYVVASTDESQNLVAGEFLLPVKSLDTGIKTRNRHLSQKSWLDFKHFSKIVFSLHGVRNVKEQSSKAGAKTYSGEIFGDMTIKGVTKEFSFPATITFMPESDATRAMAKGDLLAIRAQYSVSLSDFGVSNGIIGDKVANDITLEQFLIFSTEKPS